MAIEFRCSQCGKLLRTGDETAGKQAKCPSCGSIQPIPTSAQPSGASPGAFAPLPSGLPANPFRAPPPAPTSPLDNAPSAVETMNPYQSPVQRAMPYAREISRTKYQPTRIDVGDVLSQSWEVFTTNYWNCLGVTLVCGIINVGIAIGQELVLFVVQMAVPVPALVFTVLVMVTLLAAVLQIWIGIGQVMFLLKLARNGEGDYAAIFAGAPHIVSMILAALLVSLAGAGLTMVCAVPPIIVAVVAKDPGIGLIAFFVLGFLPFVYVVLALSQFNYLIIDQGMGPVEALRASLEITKGNKLTIFATGFVAALFGLLGILGCGIGMLFTIPFIPITLTVMYLCMTGQTNVATRLDRPYNPAPAGLSPVGPR